MEIRVLMDGRWALRGSYPDVGNPATLKHIHAAAERNALSWLTGGYRVQIDGREVGAVTPEHIAATKEAFEVVTTPFARRSYETRGGERRAA